MAKVKEVKKVSAESILAKARKIRPAGSENEIVELANTFISKGRFEYSDTAGKIIYIGG